VLLDHIAVALNRVTMNHPFKATQTIKNKTTSQSQRDACRVSPGELNRLIADSLFRPRTC
jgi:hypothetical protein